MTNKKIPAVPFMMLAAKFARANGLRFFTWKEQLNVITIYSANASKLN